MPTVKHRISMTPDDELFGQLQLLAKRRKKALSSLSLELVRRALELEEDFHFSSVADERLSRREKRISHDRAWK